MQGEKQRTARGGTGTPRVLFVYPRFPDTYWSFRHALSFIGKRSAFPPLGLLTVSAMLPTSWQRRLVDINVRSLLDGDLKWADMVFVSAMLVQRDSLREVVARSKALGKRVVVGGPYTWAGADSVEGADHVFIGEAESTIPEFLADLAAGGGKPVYQSNERPQLCQTPVADFGLVDMRHYSSMSVQYSRGCPYQCEFCDIIEIYGRVPRTKTSQQLLAELDALYAAGWRGPVFIVDDNFIGNKPGVKRLLPRLAEWSERHNRPFAFATEASLNLADDEELLELMRRAAFYRVFLGIETPVEASLLEAHKGQNTRRDLVESVRKIQGYGMEVMAGFIIGFDTDPIDIFTRQIEFIRDSAIPLAMVGLLNALPNTQLWHRLQKEGRLIADSTGDNTDGSLNFVPRMDSKRLQEGYKSVLRAIYSPAEYYRRSLDCLNRMTSGIQRPRDRGPAASVLAFARIAIALGLRGNARREFWRYLRRVMVEHRDRLGYALTLAAMGHHFRMHVEAYCGRANLEPSALGWRHACEVIWASVTTLTPRGIIRSLSRHHEARRCGGHSGRTASRAILDHPRWRDSHQVDVAAALAALRWRFSTASVAGKPSM